MNAARASVSAEVALIDLARGRFALLQGAMGTPGWKPGVPNYPAPGLDGWLTIDRGCLPALLALRRRAVGREHTALRERLAHPVEHPPIAGALLRRTLLERP